MDERGLADPAAASAAITHATEVFVRGFSFTRSFTHPYTAERVGALWVMRDAPRRRGSYRNEEWVAYSVAPEEIDRVVREHTRGKFAVCVMCGVDESQAQIRADFKALGYRLRATEALMVHRLAQIPQAESPAAIERVTTAELADELAREARSRQILPRHFAPGSRLRQYVAIIDGELVGWVRSIVVGDATWCSNMFVKPEQRRRGIARAMLCRMLRDDLAEGARTAVLLASHAGAKLYPVVGYEQIGELLLYTPGKQ